MDFKKIFYLLLLVVAAPQVLAKSCGGDIVCECGDKLTSPVKLNKSLSCENDGIVLESNIDCNGHEIIGSGLGFGLKINAKDNIRISNCRISNFTQGIRLDTRRNYYTSVHYHVIKSRYAKIFNNILDDNEYGIYSQEGIGNNIYDNRFINNKKYGLYLNSFSGKYWGNEFYGTGIFQKDTKYKSFCKDNVSNIYFDGASGPLCGCHLLLPKLLINSKVKLCKQEYHLEDPVYLGDNAQLDCNGSSIVGDGSGAAIIVNGVEKTLINDCSISNFSSGVEYRTKRVKSGYNTYYYISRDNKLFNSDFNDLDKAIVMTSRNGFESRAEKIHNNTFLNSEYNIYNNINVNIDARDNWWGSDNIKEIEKKFYKPEYINHGYVSAIEDENLLKFDIEVSNAIINGSDLIFWLTKPKSINKSFMTKVIFIKEGNISDEIELNISKDTEKIWVNDIDLNSKKIYILADSTNQIEESDESNNVYEFFIESSKKYYIEINSGLDVEKKVMENFLINILKKENIVYSLSNADVIINVSSSEVLPYYLKDFHSYAGKIISYEKDDKMHINLDSAMIEGHITTIKEFINNLDDYIYYDNYRQIEMNNTDFMRTYNYIHLLENDIFYKTNSIEYIRIIKSVLYDKMYTKQEYFFNKSGMRYKLKRFKPKLQVNNTPIVYGGGLWSNIDSWKMLAGESAASGYDSFMIELTGGIGTECNNCSNYNYSDLSSSVFISYVDEILKISNSSELNYVGHSNGARTALDSLSNNPQYSQKINKLIVLGVPGSFEDMSLFARILNRSGDIAIERLKNKNKTHVTMGDVAHELDSAFGEIVFFVNFFTDKNKISLNLFNQYYDWISRNDDTQPGTGVNINKFSLIYGDYFGGGNDIIVSVIDEIKIYDNVNSKEKSIHKTRYKHTDMTENENIYKLIKEELNIK